MAKVSARGASKLAQANREWCDADGYDHRIRLTLRSDGAVLRAHDLRSPSARENYGSRGWSRSGYSIAGKGFDMEQFAAMCLARGFAVKP